MKDLITYFQGKKANIVSAVMALYTLLNAFGVITTTPEQDQAVYGLLAALFGFAIRDAITTENRDTRGIK